MVLASEFTARSREDHFPTLGSQTESRRATRVLVVDDSALMRAAIANILRDEDHCVVVGEAENGLQALRLAHHIHPDLVVMDVHMPVMGGLEALRLLRSELPDTRVVMVSAVLDPDARETALQEGALACLEKGPGLWSELAGYLCPAVALGSCGEQ